RRAADDGGTDGFDQGEPDLTRHAATGNAMQSHLSTGFEAGPEAEEGSERKRKEHPIAEAHTRTAINGLPALEQKLPTFVGVDPAQRPSGRGRGLTVAGVALERFGESRSPWGIRGLIGVQLRLRRQRQAVEVARKLQAVERQAGVIELARVKRVAPVNRGDELGQPPTLHRRQRVPIEALRRDHSADRLKATEAAEGTGSTRSNGETEDDRRRRTVGTSATRAGAAGRSQPAASVAHTNP